ncbi:hypothetical protein EV360DRAFT_74520 [Lentinula raphanica]|nr:hypothetical protein EV360DRAFT_74520 [Lentinula raphanica]
MHPTFIMFILSFILAVPHTIVALPMQRFLKEASSSVPQPEHQGPVWIELKEYPLPHASKPKQSFPTGSIPASLESAFEIAVYGDPECETRYLGTLEGYRGERHDLDLEGRCLKFVQAFPDKDCALEMECRNRIRRFRKDYTANTNLVVRESFTSVAVDCSGDINI